VVAAERVRRQKFLRVALVLQAAGLLALIALTVPDWIDGLLHPYAVGCGLCLDFRGLPFYLAAAGLGPVAVLLLILGWMWRGRRLWPLGLVVLVDAAAIFLTVDVAIGFFHNRTDSIPPLASAPLLLLLPALGTLALGLNLVRPVRLRPVLAASAAGCILLAAFLWFFSIRPVHQSIPGELSLPFSKTAVYEGRSLGCQDQVQGWIDEHRCTRATLLVYRGTGDLSKDEATIEQVLSAQLRRVPAGELIQPLPLDMGVSRTQNPDVDPSNAGFCLIITGRAATPASSMKVGHCGTVTDYTDISSHWPWDDAYAIGVIYYWEGRDYVSDHSVTFLSPVSAEPGRPATVRVRADKDTRCSIVVTDSSGQANVPGLDPKTTDAAGEADWTWMVDPGAKPGQWPISVTCGASTGRASWFIYGPPA
jgi:hypothetical protein